MNLYDYLSSLSELGGPSSPRVYRTPPSKVPSGTFAVVSELVEGKQQSYGRADVNALLVNVALFDPDGTRYNRGLADDYVPLTNLVNKLASLRDVNRGGVIDADFTPGVFLGLEVQTVTRVVPDPETRCLFAAVRYRVLVIRP